MDQMSHYVKPVFDVPSMYDLVLEPENEENESRIGPDRHEKSLTFVRYALQLEAIDDGWLNGIERPSMPLSRLYS